MIIVLNCKFVYIFVNFFFGFEYVPDFMQLKVKFNYVSVLFYSISSKFTSWTKVY
jgi:hypothetical protein